MQYRVPTESNILRFCFVYFGLRTVLAQPNETKRLELLGFLPMTGKGWAGGGACLPAALMATRHVNDRSGLLDGYTLIYSWVDTQVNRCLVYMSIFVLKLVKYNVMCDLVPNPTNK